jgi:hypothetical protein
MLPSVRIIMIDVITTPPLNHMRDSLRGDYNKAAINPTTTLNAENPIVKPSNWDQTPRAALLPTPLPPLGAPFTLMPPPSPPGGPPFALLPPVTEALAKVLPAKLSRLTAELGVGKTMVLDSALK